VNCTVPHISFQCAAVCLDLGDHPDYDGDSVPLRGQLCTMCSAHADTFGTYMLPSIPRFGKNVLVIIVLVLLHGTLIFRDGSGQLRVTPPFGFKV